MTSKLPFILNLTQHKSTKDQIDADIRDLPDDYLARLLDLLTFSDIPSEMEIKDRARGIALLAEEYFNSSDDVWFEGCMIGGAPYLMSELEIALKEWGFTPCYAFSVRDTEEKQNDDGTVSKLTVFRHKWLIYV